MCVKHPGTPIVSISRVWRDHPVNGVWDGTIAFENRRKGGRCGVEMSTPSVRESEMKKVV